jgi:DNA-directed RNA polymerase subunit L
LNTMGFDIQVCVRMPGDMHRAVKALADEAGVPLADMVRQAVDALTWSYRMEHFQEFIDEDQPWEWVEGVLERQLKVAVDHGTAAERLQRALRKQLHELRESRQQVTTEAIEGALKGARQAREQPELVPE